MLQWAVAMGCANRAGQSAVTLAMTDLAVLMELRTDFDLPACGLNGTCWAGRDAGLFCAGLSGGFTLYGRHFWQFFCGQEHSTEACPKPILRGGQHAQGARKQVQLICQWSEVHKASGSAAHRSIGETLVDWDPRSQSIFSRHQRGVDAG